MTASNKPENQNPNGLHDLGQITFKADQKQISDRSTVSDLVAIGEDLFPISIASPATNEAAKVIADTLNRTLYRLLQCGSDREIRRISSAITNALWH